MSIERFSIVVVKWFALFTVATTFGSIVFFAISGEVPTIALNQVGLQYRYSQLWDILFFPLFIVTCAGVHLFVYSCRLLSKDSDDPTLTIIALLLTTFFCSLSLLSGDPAAPILVSKFVLLIAIGFAFVPITAGGGNFKRGIHIVIGAIMGIGLFLGFFLGFGFTLVVSLALIFATTLAILGIEILLIGTVGNIKALLKIDFSNLLDKTVAFLCGEDEESTPCHSNGTGKRGSEDTDCN